MLAGVDGYKNGWIAALLLGDGSTEVKVFPTFRSLVDDNSLALIVIDIPIGLPDSGARCCDQKARKCLGRYRGSSVFPAPIRSMLKANDWEDACRIRFERESKKCSKQLWSILPKIREVDEAMTGKIQQRVREGHPEVSFFMMNGEIPMTSPKKTKKGQLDRLDLLRRWFFDAEKHLKVVPGASIDVLDAYACLWTAQRVTTNQSRSFSSYRIQDAVGLNMEIVA